MSTGSPAKSGVPSGTANTSPVKRKLAQVIEERWRRQGETAGGRAGSAISSSVKLQVEQVVDGLREAGGEDEVAVRAAGGGRRTRRWRFLRVLPASK